jgi:hypothetical protein
MSVYVDIDVEDYLYDIKTSTLEQELKSRYKSMAKDYLLHKKELIKSFSEQRFDDDLKCEIILTMLGLNNLASLEDIHKQINYLYKEL